MITMIKIGKEKDKRRRRYSDLRDMVVMKKNQGTLKTNANKKFKE